MSFSSRRNEIDPFLRWIQGDDTVFAKGNDTAIRESYIKYTDATLVDKLTQIKESILENLILEISDFQTYFN